MKTFNSISLDHTKYSISDLLVNNFLSNDRKYSRYIIGKNEESAFLTKMFSINGIIDDFASEKYLWHDVPSVKMSDIDKDAIVVNCSSSISPISVITNCKKNGINNVIGYHELTYNNDKIPFPCFVKEMRNDYQNNYLKWESLYSKLEDDESKVILTDVLKYRFTGDYNFMENYKVRLNDQYFEGFMNYKNETFADIGGFDGDSTQEFCSRYPDYNKVFFFEPSQVNMYAAKKRLVDFRDINFLDFGLSDTTETLYFNQNDGSASSICELSDTKIKVSTLDELVKESISVIKMDIEGYELRALNGCRNHILNDRPKLAIAVYHKAKDFWELPEFILSLNPEYKMYLRHYTEGWSETVMYFV